MKEIYWLKSKVRIWRIFHIPDEESRCGLFGRQYLQIKNFEEPFILVIHEGDILADVKVHIQRKLQVPMRSPIRMENQQAIGVTFDKFTWKIEDFSKVKTKKLSSKTFKVDGYQWRILVYPKGKNVDHLSLYLKIADSLPPYGWSRFAYFRLTLINQADSRKSIVKETQQKFNAGNNGWGSPSFIPLSDFHDLSQGYLVNDTCIIEAHVSVSKVAFNILDSLAKSISTTSTHESNGNQAGQTEAEHQGRAPSDVTESIKIHESEDDQTGQTEVESLHLEDQGIRLSDVFPSPRQVYFLPSAPPLYPPIFNEPVEILLSPLSELIDFKSLGPEEAAFFTLVEEVCSWHPSLIDCQRKRSPRFILWAFTALGRVLYFLKTMKVRDMSEDSYNDLQVLWEELESFGFDLTWLKPHVQSAMGAKAYLERVEQVKNLKDNVVAVEIEVRTRSAKLALAEFDLEVARRDLAEVEKGFEENAMDTELGYGIP